MAGSSPPATLEAGPRGHLAGVRRRLWDITVTRYELTIPVRVSLDGRVYLLNVLWSHPPSIPQAVLGQDLYSTRRCLRGLAPVMEGRQGTHSCPVPSGGLRVQVTGRGGG